MFTRPLSTAIKTSVKNQGVRNFTKTSLPTRNISTTASNANSKSQANIDKCQQLKDLKSRPLYLDAQATSPIDPRVLDAMLPYMTGMYGNPHSRTHAYGWESEIAVEKAREVDLNPKKARIYRFWNS